MEPTTVAPQSAWFKSSYSSGAEGNCVTTAILNGRVAVRDSKVNFEQEQGVLLIPASAWSDFLGLVRA